MLSNSKEIEDEVQEKMGEQSGSEEEGNKNKQIQKKGGSLSLIVHI